VSFAIDKAIRSDLLTISRKQLAGVQDGTRYVADEIQGPSSESMFGNSPASGRVSIIEFTIREASGASRRITTKVDVFFNLQERIFLGKRETGATLFATDSNGVEASPTALIEGASSPGEGEEITLHANQSPWPLSARIGESGDLYQFFSTVKVRDADGAQSDRVTEVGRATWALVPIGLSEQARPTSATRAPFDRSEEARKTDRSKARRLKSDNAKGGALTDSGVPDLGLFCINQEITKHTGNRLVTADCMVIKPSGQIVAHRFAMSMPKGILVLGDALTP
jgi:hypothetical protein